MWVVVVLHPTFACELMWLVMGAIPHFIKLPTNILLVAKRKKKKTSVVQSHKWGGSTILDWLIDWLAIGFEPIWSWFTKAFWRSEDRASWYILVIKPTRYTNFSNLFCKRTLHVSDRFTAHHQESSTVYTAIGYADCLLAGSQHNLYDIYLLLCIQYQTPDDGQ